MKTLLALIAAATAMAQPKAAPVAPAKVAMGAYECWANSRPRLLLNFSIKNATQYTDADDKPGNYSYDARSGRISFKGAGLDGVMPKGFYTIYHEPKGFPTVSYRNSEGYEVSYCEKVK